MLHFILKYGLILFAGGLATSYAEYKFKYNLYDLLKDKISAVINFFKKLFGKKPAAPPVLPASKS